MSGLKTRDLVALRTYCSLDVFRSKALFGGISRKRYEGDFL